MATLDSSRPIQGIYEPTRRVWQHFDILLLALVVLTMIFGVAMIRSTTLGSPSLFERPIQQIQWAAIGLVLMFIVAAIDYRYWQNLSLYMYGGVLLFLISVFILGQVTFGVQRWLDIFGQFNLQPSEMAKLGSIIWVASFFARYREKLRQFRWVIASLLFAGFPAALIIAQPDLSTAIALMVIWFGVAWAAGLRLQHLAIFGGAGLLGMPLLWTFMAGYQRARILQFINPALDEGAQYNINQAIISIGSGGLFGQGYNQSTQVQLRFLKVRHTDFIFSATAAEFGLIGVVVMMLALLLIVVRILRVARLAGDPFGSYICYGAATIIFFQIFVNIGMNLNLMPVTGLPLPFVSYGGSSLLTFLITIGLVQSVALRHKRIDF